MDMTKLKEIPEIKTPPSPVEQTLEAIFRDIENFKHNPQLQRKVIEADLQTLYNEADLKGYAAGIRTAAILNKIDNSGQTEDYSSATDEDVERRTEIFLAEQELFNLNPREHE